MSSKNKATASCAIDSVNNLFSPLDFSFKSLAGFIDVQDEEPRPGLHRILKNEETGKYKTNSVRLCYNAISDFQDFASTIEHFLENPSDLEWLDISFNDISTIDTVFLQYPKLKILYLHSNSIESLLEIDKLAGLPELISLTLHGNPIENTPGYRQYVVSKLPNLKKLDFSPITRQDCTVAQTWRNMCGPNFQKKLARAEKKSKTS